MRLKGLKSPAVSIGEGRGVYGKVSVDREDVILADPHRTGNFFHQFLEVGNWTIIAGAKNGLSRLLKRYGYAPRSLSRHLNILLAGSSGKRLGGIVD
jgi:hypothetical protein